MRHWSARAFSVCQRATDEAAARITLAGMIFVLLAAVLLPSAGMASEADKAQNDPMTASDGQRLLSLDPFHFPMTTPNRRSQAQAVLSMQLILGNDTETARLRSLMPRFRDALIREFFGFPLSQDGDFPAGILTSVTNRVLVTAERVYGKGAVTGVLFGHVMKMGC